MYYFLAITLDADVLNGSFWPSYVLCKSWTESEKRTGWRVTKQLEGKPTKKLPRLLVTSMFGHEDLIFFLSNYITQDSFKGKHYFPHGYLCWYECNKYGEETGVVHLIKHVPEEENWGLMNQSKLRKLKAIQEKKPSLKEVFSKEALCISASHKKPKLVQTKLKQRKKGKK